MLFEEAFEYKTLRGRILDMFHDCEAVFTESIYEMEYNGLE